MSTYSKLQQKIQALQAQADRLRKAELASVIARVRQTIEEFSLTPEDLFGAATTTARKKAAPAKRAKRAGAGVPKYQDPKTGKTWTGFGKPPSWIAGKRDRAPFLIEAGAEPNRVEAIGDVPKRKAATARKAASKGVAKRAASKRSKKTSPARVQESQSSATTEHAA